MSCKEKSLFVRRLFAVIEGIGHGMENGPGTESGPGDYVDIGGLGGQDAVENCFGLCPAAVDVFDELNTGNFSVPDGDIQFHLD